MNVRKIFLLSNDVHVNQKEQKERHQQRQSLSVDQYLIEYIIVDTSCQQSNW
jgi:hypothetical protein